METIKEIINEYFILLLPIFMIWLIWSNLKYDEEILKTIKDFKQNKTAIFAKPCYCKFHWYMKYMAVGFAIYEDCVVINWRNISEIKFSEITKVEIVRTFPFIKGIKIHHKNKNIADKIVISFSETENYNNILEILNSRISK